MHPVICIVSFATLSVFVATAQAANLILSSILLSSLYWIGNTPIDPALKMLRRMRWFFISILVLYFWFTPGDVLVPGLPGWLSSLLPSKNGFQEGIARLVALVVIVVAANLLLRSTTREQLLGAIYWLIAPLFKLAAERVALRMVLTIEAVEKVQPIISATLKDIQHARSLGEIGVTTASIFNKTLAGAGQEALAKIDIPTAGSPPLYQWLYPILLTAVMVLL